MTHFLASVGFHFMDLFHPLRYWGYEFWSGIGSDAGELTLLGIAYGAWRHVNCHVKGCPRLGKHLVKGTPYKVCRRHHPDVPNRGATLEHIHAAHRKSDSD